MGLPEHMGAGTPPGRLAARGDAWANPALTFNALATSSLGRLICSVPRLKRPATLAPWSKEGGAEPWSSLSRTPGARWRGADLSPAR